MDQIKVLDAEVWWGDGYENAPSVTFTLDRAPCWDIYDKRPGGGRGQLSTEQEAVVGRGLSAPTTPGWHVYWSEDDGFVTFFTWGGKPDDGCGGSRRQVRLRDGGSELVVGGWHVGPGVAVAAGLPATIDTAMRVKGGYRTAIACFITVERFHFAVAHHLPDVEIVGNTVKWRGQLSKAEFMAAERVRRDLIRDELEAKYHDGSWWGGNWYSKSTQAERDAIACAPYSALGPPGRSRDARPAHEERAIAVATARRMSASAP
jgi:hypothetical protein